MNHDLVSRLSNESKFLKKQKDLLEKRLDDLEAYSSMSLRRSIRKNGRTYYSVRGRGDGKFRYAGKSDNKTVQRVKEAAHLQPAIEVIDNNLQLIENLLDGYSPFDFATIDKALPEVYRLDPPAVHPSYQEVGRRWKKEKLSYQATFPENYPEFKTERTGDGTMVKTISEALLYDRFTDAGLIHIYELPQPSRDYRAPIYPDFTVLSPVDLKTEIIVEYVGRLDLPKYRDDFAARIYRYMRNGYIPGVNLFFAFGDLEGHLDSLQVTKIIMDILCMREL